jgi:SH3 domain-containing YSC84-like protein 1
MENIMTLSKRYIISLFFLISGSIITVSASANEYSEPQALVEESCIVFQHFQEASNMTWFLDNVQYAKALFIVPQMLKAGCVIGGSGGSELLLSRDMKSRDWTLRDLHPTQHPFGDTNLS